MNHLAPLRASQLREGDHLLDDAGWRADHEREAEEWAQGAHSDDHYTETTLALDALHRLGATPAVIERLHRLAKDRSLTLTEKLRDIAEAHMEQLRNEGEEARSFAQADARQGWAA